MYEWQKQIQTVVDEIDKCIKGLRIVNHLTTFYCS